MAPVVESPTASTSEQPIDVNDAAAAAPAPAVAVISPNGGGGANTFASDLSASACSFLIDRDLNAMFGGEVQPPAESPLENSIVIEEPEPPPFAELAADGSAYDPEAEMIRLGIIQSSASAPSVAAPVSDPQRPTRRPRYLERL